MFDELYPSTLAFWGIAATLVGAALGVLPTGRLRFGLITFWTLVQCGSLLLLLPWIGAPQVHGRLGLS